MSDWTIVFDDGDPYIIGEDIKVGPLQPVHPGLTGLVCVDCGHAALADPTSSHHLVCDCETCDVPSDERGLVGEMRRRAGDPRWWEATGEGE